MTLQLFKYGISKSVRGERDVVAEVECSANNSTGSAAWDATDDSNSTCRGLAEIILSVNRFSIEGSTPVEPR